MTKFNFAELGEKKTIQKDPLQVKTEKVVQVKKVPVTPKKKVKKLNKISQKKKFVKTIDLDRGIYRLMTHIGDKEMDKEEIEDQIRKGFINPESLANLFINLASYIKSE